AAKAPGIVAAQVGSWAGSGGMADEARRAGGTQLQQDIARGVGALIGYGEGIPIARAIERYSGGVLGPIQTVIVGRFGSRLGRVLGAAAGEASEEGLQEFSQQTA